MKSVRLAIILAVSVLGSAAFASYPVEMDCKATSNNPKIRTLSVRAHDYYKNSQGVMAGEYGHLDVNPRGCFATGGNLNKQQFEALSQKTRSVTVGISLNCNSTMPQDPNTIKGVTLTVSAGMTSVTVQLPDGQVDFYDCNEIGDFRKGTSDFLRSLGPNIGS
jgi:hypothetical protein